MTEVNYPEGRTAFYSGAMDAPAGKARQIRVITPAVFATLTPKFPYVQTSPDHQVDVAADASSITFPALYILHNLASFKLTSGKIEVIFSL